MDFSNIWDSSTLCRDILDNIINLLEMKIIKDQSPLKFVFY